MVNRSTRFNSRNFLKPKITFLYVPPLNVIFGEKWLIFKEGDIPGDIKFLGSKEITPLPFLCGGISKEKTFVGFRVKFAPIVLMDMDKGSAFKYFLWQGGHYTGIWIDLKEFLERCLKLESSRRYFIDKVGGSKD